MARPITAVADRQAHRDHGAERDQQDDHRGQQADQLGRARLGLRPPRGVLAADLRLEVGGADVVEGRLERLERLDAQVDGRLVVGDLCVADRAVGREGARGLERVRTRRSRAAGPQIVSNVEFTASAWSSSGPLGAWKTMYAEVPEAAG